MLLLKKSFYLWQEEAARRLAEPKKEKKQKVMSAAEKMLSQQNRDVLVDSESQAKKRLKFLLGQSDLFKHFGLTDVRHLR